MADVQSDMADAQGNIVNAQKLEPRPTAYSLSIFTIYSQSGCNPINQTQSVDLVDTNGELGR
ncbi:hypothetical protein K08M4_39130 [Vibrio syngnathi]|uniref:Uncharacterized protein n=1 Tax=Vibrio syngnathi TaxID=3034029 RepID=A0AA34TT69_9VIBR|nr:hypothetical protein K08M4_39130 [Vibrio syngnathi]